MSLEFNRPDPVPFRHEDRPVTGSIEHKDRLQSLNVDAAALAAALKNAIRGEEAGLLRIDYPGYSGADTLERIDWDAWFDKFDAEKLAFLYQDKRNSRFSKLVRR